MPSVQLDLGLADEATDHIELLLQAATDAFVNVITAAVIYDNRLPHETDEDVALAIAEDNYFVGGYGY